MPLPTQNSKSQMLEYLPAIFHKDPFLGRFLKAFEEILLGGSDEAPKTEIGKAAFQNMGLEETIDCLSIIFDPQEAPEEFLSWLSDWTAFSIRADLTVKQERDFLSNIIKLYRHRGTKENLQELLSIFTVGKPEVIEIEGDDFQIGVNSVVGDDGVLLGGAPPHYFEVVISLPEGLDDKHKNLGRQLEIARSLIETEKPAHTNYRLILKFPSMQIGESSTVGIDTLLGTIPEN